jgi:hypothetical protein
MRRETLSSENHAITGSENRNSFHFQQQQTVAKGNSLLLQVCLSTSLVQ